MNEEMKEEKAVHGSTDSQVKPEEETAREGEVLPSPSREGTISRELPLEETAGEKVPPEGAATQEVPMQEVDTEEGSPEGAATGQIPPEGRGIEKAPPEGISRGELPPEESSSEKISPEGPEGASSEEISPEEKATEEEVRAETLTLEEMAAEVSRLQERENELTQQFLRLQADFENHKRRTREQMKETILRANENLIRELLPVLDNLERAMAAVSEDNGESVRSGIELVYKQFLDVLQKEGLKPIPAAGEPFDPRIHEAVMQVETDDPEMDGRVVEELQKGYSFHDRVLRASMVKVGKVAQ